MYFSRGLGACDPTVDATCTDVVVGGVDLSSLSATAAGLLNTPVTIGQNTAPAWGILAVFGCAAWLVTTLASTASSATKRVTGRAKKIKRGFLS